MSGQKEGAHHEVHFKHGSGISKLETGFVNHRRRGNFLRKPLILLGAIGGVALTSGGAYVGLEYLSRPNGYRQLSSAAGKEIVIDNTESLISFNTHDEGSKFARALLHWANKDNDQVDTILLQEEDPQDAEKLAKLMPGWNAYYDPADNGQHFKEGGYGNEDLTRQEGKNIHTGNFPGTSTIDSAMRTVAGAGQDLVSLDPSFQHTIDGRQENRSGISLDTQVVSGDQLENITQINGHITGAGSDPTLHHDQLKEAMQFIGSQTRPDTPAVACFDFNESNEAIMTREFEKQKYYLIPKTVGLHSSGNGDWCGANLANETTKPTAKVLEGTHSDHWGIEVTWRLNGNSTQ